MNCFSNFYSVKNQVFNEDSTLSDRSTKIYDIRQLFGGPSMEIEGAVRYLMNFVGNKPQEILICLALQDPENLNKSVLDEVKDVLMTVPLFK